MQAALVARQSYRQALKDTPQGPLRDRFSDMGERVDEVAEGLYKLVVRAQSLRGYLSRSPADAKLAELQRAQGHLRTARGSPSEAAISAEVEALEQQVAARRRIQAAYDDAMAKIAATTARLDQLAAQLTEVVLLNEDQTALVGVPGGDEMTRL